MARQEQSRSKRRGSRRTAINLTDLKRSLKELKGGEPSEVEVAERAMRKDLRALRRSVAKRLEPLVVDGIDVDKAKAILADHEEKRTQLLKRSKSAVLKAMAAVGNKQALGVADRRRASEIPATPGFPFTPPSVSLTPVLIWAKSDRPRSNILLDSNASPDLSVARVAMTATELPPDGEETFRVTFYYLWINDHDYYEVVNAKCFMVFSGICTVTASTGIFDGGTSEVNCSVSLSPLEWWKQPTTTPKPSQPSQSWNVFSIEADAGGLFSLKSIGRVPLSGINHDLRYDLFVIPPGMAAMFNVEVLFECSVDDGSIEMDFASIPDEPFQRHAGIGCGLELELLNAPGAIGPVSLGGGVISG
jgi:hypothetical protein